MTITQLDDGGLEFSVKGMRFRQNPKSPELFAFVASSNELIKFCGVARKSHGLLANYQRALDKERVRNEVTPFFKVPENCSPTAIVLSLQPSNVCEILFASDASNAINLLPEGEVFSQSSRIGSGVIDELRVKFHDFEKMPDAKVIELAKSFLDIRLQDNPERPEETIDESSTDSDLQEVDIEIEDSTDSLDFESEEDASDEPVEIGKSMLRDIRMQLENAEQLTPEFIKSLKEMLMPALVIDGQHRLFGAAGVEEDIPVLVCSLVKPTWKEQVFQFVVVNDKAAGIPKPFITSLAGMSLTTNELNQLQHRLTQAGLKLWEVEVMQKLGYDSRSPFRDRIEFEVESTRAEKRLGYQTMKRIGKTWHSPRSAGLYTIMQKLYLDPRTDERTSKKTLRSKWQANEDWFLFFCMFWNEFREKFEGTPVWEMHSNLMKAVVLEMLQNDFLLYVDSTKDLVWDIEEEDEDKRRKAVENIFLRKLVKTFADKHKDSIYTKKWHATSLNHKSGKEALADFFQKIRDGKSVTNSGIYTGQI